MGESNHLPPVELYTDGSCLGNPGPGGWAALLLFRQKDQIHEKMIDGCEPDTTNNRMELTAAIRALGVLKRECRVALWTDSEYLRKGITEWLANWKKRNWQTAAKKPVVNKDLWQRLETAAERHRVKWHWVRGHSGHSENERADRLANRGIDEAEIGA